MSKIKLKTNYVSEIIGSEYKNWKKGDVVTITSQTGSGKTFFVKNNLISYMDKLNKTTVEKQDYKMLILTNRVALARQTKKDILIKLGIKLPSTIEKLDEIKEIGNVTIMNYQYLLQLLRYDRDSFNMDDYLYVVMDEVHYILSDSFVGGTEVVANELFRKESDSVRILISATMEGILDRVNNMDYENIYQYDTKVDHSYLEPTFYSRKQQILDLIVKDKANEDKWIWFVSSKQHGEEIKAYLEKKKISCCFLYRGALRGKNKAHAQKEYENIINNEKFDSKVLITTAILDAGVNLKDDNIKNIVCNSWEKRNLVQSIGRVRFESLDKAYMINLYLDIKNKKQINAKIKNINNTLGKFELLIEDQEEFERINRYKLNKLPNGIFLDENNKFTYDKLTYEFLKEQKEELEQYTKDTIQFCYRELKWLKVRGIPAILDEIEEEQHKDEIKEYLNSVVNQPLDKSAREELISLINLTDNRGRKQKTLKTISSYLEGTYSMTIESKRLRINETRAIYWIVKK